MSRGLILNSKTGEIVARPFDKFFNWQEGNRTSTAKIKTITNKMDGSLGILYRQDGQYKVSTRGSFTSDQAIWATDFLNKNHNLTQLSNELTLLFEIIYPKNRIVINYNGKQGLVLLAARNRFTGEYLDFNEVKKIALVHHFEVPNVSQINSIQDLTLVLPILSGNEEGFVVEFEDGQRFKFKGNEYKKLHKMISGLSFKNTVEAMKKNEIDQIKGVIPDEFLIEFDSWVAEIEETIKNFKQEVKEAFDKLPKDTRKDFALAVMKDYKHLSAYLFAVYTNQDITPLILKHAFVNRKPEGIKTDKFEE